MNCVCTGSLRLKLVTWKLIKNSLKISAKNFSYYADYAENIAEPTTFCFAVAQRAIPYLSSSFGLG